MHVEAMTHSFHPGWYMTDIVNSVNPPTSAPSLNRPPLSAFFLLLGTPPSAAPPPPPPAFFSLLYRLSICYTAYPSFTTLCLECCLKHFTRSISLHYLIQLVSSFLLCHEETDTQKHSVAYLSPRGWWGGGGLGVDSRLA